MLVQALEYENVHFSVAAAAAPGLPTTSMRNGQPLGSGQYAYACCAGGDVLFARDPLGCNKLFYGVAENGMLVATSRITAALDAGVTVDRLASCPPGHVIRWRKGEATVEAGHDLSIVPEDPHLDLQAFQSDVRQALESAFDWILEYWKDATFVVCLSGGLDSSAIAAIARERLPRVAAVSFSYLTAEDVKAWLAGMPLDQLGSLSEDFRCALAVAEALELPLLPVIRTTEAVPIAIPLALRLGQDWRDFNVHCALVNVFLAQDLRARFPGRQVVVFTGDLMNEFVCDYVEERVDGTVYYPQPRVPLRNRRRFLVRGLDAGDREIGVFNGYGLILVQPYAAVAWHYMRVPAELLGRPDVKSVLNEHLLPKSVRPYVARAKRRAQVGGEDGGTLGVFHRLGIGQDRLARMWVEGLPANRRGQAPHDIIQFGRYRTAPREA